MKPENINRHGEAAESIAGNDEFNSIIYIKRKYKILKIFVDRLTKPIYCLIRTRHCGKYGKHRTVLAILQRTTKGEEK